jgi:hypothetical protein
VSHYVADLDGACCEDPELLIAVLRRSRPSIVRLDPAGHPSPSAAVAHLGFEPGNTASDERRPERGAFRNGNDING